MRRVPCVVLAGGRAKPDMEALTGQSCRALVSVNGRRLLDCVVDSLVAAENCGEITVVGNVPKADHYQTLPDTDDFVENVLSGAGRYPDAPYVLIATSDLPFLTGEIVSEFVAQAAALADKTGADLIYPVVPVADCYARYPGVKRTGLRLREGELTGGNLMLVRPTFLQSRKKQLADAFAARKSPMRLAGMLGWSTVALLAASQLISPKLLTIPLLEARVSRLVGGPAKALLCSHPEIATDLDRPSDFAAVGLQSQ